MDPDAQREDILDRLTADLRARRPTAISGMATMFGRELTGVAYLILQSADEAVEAAAEAVATIWRTASATDMPNDVSLRRQLLTATARAALIRHGRSRTVDPGTDRAWVALVDGLGPQARAAAALCAVGLDDATIADALAVPLDRVRHQLAGASDTAIADAIRAVPGRVPMLLDAEHVRAALARPPSTRVRDRRLPLAAAALVAAGLLIFGLNQPTDAPAAADSSPIPAESSPIPADSPATPGPPRPALGPADTPRHDAVTAFTLEACDLQPVDAPIVFAGWLTAAEIGADLAPAGQAVYVVVPLGPVQRPGVGTDGRLACVHDPVAQRFAAVSIPEAWEAPVLADGCPASPFGRFAGYVEIGGPGAFLVLDIRGGWQAEDPDLSFYARVVPAPPPGAVVEAWLVSLDGSERLATEVLSPPPVEGARPSRTHYIRIDEVNAPRPGCWALNVTVDGTVVGSAIIPISAAVAAAG